MLVNFCPNCGQRAEQVFNFCPHCGVKLPKEETVFVAETTAAAWYTSPVAQGPEEQDESPGRKGRRKTKSPVSSPKTQSSSTPIKDVIPSPAIPPILKTFVEGPEEQDDHPGKNGRKNPKCPVSSPKTQPSFTPTKGVIPSPAIPPIFKTFVEEPKQEDCLSIGPGRSKRKAPASSPQKECSPIKQESVQPITSLADRSIVKGKGSPQKKRSKGISVEPLPVDQILTDNSTKNWKLVTLLSHGSCGLLYAAEPASASVPAKQRFSLKLDAKNGRIYNEHNFLQRAAKKVTVDKWKKSHMISFLGIPNCIGFGLHADNYRFLVFPDLGRSLQLVLDANKGMLSEKATFQIAFRMLDVFEYIHENEYIHGDLKAEDIFVNPEDLGEVYLASYFSVYRYCPGGKHVAYLEGSRKPHEGPVEFISLDIHKDAGPSRRSDLEMLGYCMLKWLCGSLPWSTETTVPAVRSRKEKYKADVAGLLKQCFGKKKHPDALKTYLDYVMRLNYEEKPDYDSLRKIFAAPLDKMKSSAYDPVDLKVLP